MQEPYDPHQDPAPEPSDVKAVRYALLGTVFTALVALMLSRFCGGISHSYCSPSDTWTWLLSSGGWWKTLLGLATIWCVTAVLDWSRKAP